MRQKIGSGVLGWDSRERRSNRYGSVALDDAPYSGEVVTRATLEACVLDLVGARVRLTARVLESRDSGHIGDLFLKVWPSRPDVGEEVEVGVGVLRLGPGFGRLPCVELHPLDGRSKLWIDPRKLYRLHDQTVDLFAEVTADEPPPVAALETHDDEEAVGDGAGNLQVKCRDDAAYTIPAKVEPLGNGLFVVTPVGAAGERFKMVRK